MAEYKTPDRDARRAYAGIAAADVRGFADDLARNNGLGQVLPAGKRRQVHAANLSRRRARHAKFRISFPYIVASARMKGKSF
jgi:hypothetical protein